MKFSEMPYVRPDMEAAKADAAAPPNPGQDTPPSCQASPERGF